MIVDLAFRQADVTSGGYDAALVVDVLRATSVMVSLVAGGAPAVLLARDIEHARHLKSKLGEGWYTSGARRGRKVDDFDFSNSMCDFAGLDLAGFRFIISTTNGTGAVYKTMDLAGDLYVGALLNAGATARALSACGGRILVVLSGILGRYSIDDALAAGLILNRLEDMAGGTYSDEARTCMLMARNSLEVDRQLRNSATGRALLSVGLGDEIDFVLDVDRFDTAVYVEKYDEDGTLGLKSRTL